MENIIVVAVLLAIVCGIILYLYKARKRGEKCIGCPYAKQCAEKKCCDIGQATEKNEK